MATLKQETITGVKWSMIGQTITRVITLVISIILARLIPPEEFGLLGMVMVFVAFAQNFSNLGFGAAIIYKQSEDTNFLSSVFWFNIFAGILLAIIIASFSYPVALFYNEARLQNITLGISFTMIISSANIVQGALFRKNLQFKVLSISQIISSVGGGIIAIIAAFKGLGVWALIIQQYTQSIIKTIIIWIKSSWRPKLFFSLSDIKSVWKFGSNLTGFNLLNFFSRNMDNILIGKFLGSGALGIYSRGYSFVKMPIQQISAVLGKVMFPSLAKIKNDHDKLKSVYIKTCQLISFITFPMMLGFYVVSDEFVNIFLGEKWVETIPLLKIFSILSLHQSISFTTGWIYQVTGKTDLQFKWGIFSSLMTITAFAIGVYLGNPFYVALSYLLCVLIIFFYPVYKIPFLQINLSFVKFFKSLSTNIINSGVLFIIIYLIDKFLIYTFSEFFQFIIIIIVAVLLYIILITITKPEILYYIINHFRTKIPIINKYAKTFLKA